MPTTVTFTDLSGEKQTREFTHYGSAVMFHNSLPLSLGAEITVTGRLATEDPLTQSVPTEDPLTQSVPSEVIEPEIVSQTEPQFGIALVAAAAAVLSTMSITDLRKAASKAGLKGAYKGHTKADLIRFLTEANTL
jgi:hypothetical protein